MKNEPLHWNVGGRSRPLDGAAALRDALVDSLSPRDVPGHMWVRVGPDDVEPAWAWLGRLIVARSDWRAVSGLALAAALRAGGTPAWVALTDLFAWDRAAALLREWVEPLAPTAPDVGGTLARNGLGGSSTPRLADVLRDQASMLATATDPARRVVLDEWNGPFVPRMASLSTDAEVRLLLAETADLGRSWRTSWGAGAWGWLYEAFLFRPGLDDALPSHIESVVAERESRVFAALAWLSTRWDLRRFAPLLSSWRQSGASFLDAPRDHQPNGWRFPPLAVFENASTCGDAIDALLEGARHEMRTVPKVDLPHP